MFFYQKSLTIKKAYDIISISIIRYVIFDIMQTEYHVIFVSVTNKLDIYK